MADTLVTLWLKEVHSSEFPKFCVFTIYPGLWSIEASNLETLMSTNNNNENPFSCQRTRKEATRQDRKLVDKKHAIVANTLGRTTVMARLPFPITGPVGNPNSHPFPAMCPSSPSPNQQRLIGEPGIIPYLTASKILLFPVYKYQRSLPKQKSEIRSRVLEHWTQNVQDTIENDLSCEEPEPSELEWKKQPTNRHELSWHRCFHSIIKCFSEQLTQMKK